MGWKSRKTIIGLLLCALNSIFVLGKQGNETLDACFDRTFQSVQDVECYPREIVLDSLSWSAFMQNDRVKRWQCSVQEDALSTYSIKTEDNDYLIMSSELFAPTGLMVNFHSWLLMDIKNGIVAGDGMLSLSADKRSWFIRNGALYFTLFKFGDEFYNNRDFDKFPIQAVTYTLRDGTMEELYRLDASNATN